MKTLACLAVLLMVCGSVCAGEQTAPNTGAATAPAEGPPNIQETAAFVVNKLRKGGLKEIVFIGKELQFNSPESGKAAAITLSKCDPERVEISSKATTGQVSIVLYGSNDEVIYNDTSEKEGRDKYEVSAGSKEDAERLAKAFRHLIKLCGGKKSAF